LARATRRVARVQRIVICGCKLAPTNVAPIAADGRGDAVIHRGSGSLGLRGGGERGRKRKRGEHAETHGSCFYRLSLSTLA
jgi:hypothetical protein